MIIKLAALTDKLGLTAFSKKLAKNPALANKIKNASLVGTIGLGDGVLRVINRKPNESKAKAFGHGAAEGIFAGGLIAGADQIVDSLAEHGAKKLNIFGR